MHRSIKFLGVSALAAGIAACGGGGSSSGETGTVSFGVTDAPATDFSNVTVAFTELRLKPADGDWISFPLEGFASQNLLELQGGISAPLITDEEVPAGTYTELRLIVDTDNSFVKLESSGDSTYTLAVPSGEQSGLKLKGEFVVAADTSTDFTVDFDVHKSIVDPQGGSLADYLLKPSMRLVNNLEVGSITGLVDYATINSSNACDYEGSAYIFAGADVEPSDLNVNNENGNPLLVIPVSLDNESSLYKYTAGFLPAGEQYTVSYSCQQDDNGQDDNIEFFGNQNVTVTAGETTQAQTIPLTQ
ncbi:DUF4382 domain-containing protein [Marinobacter qingdaonensis]|uniref:DUF4382 domain-containing protein n=1 Tax=Marinobacter qingdaonensis TaxID=3108486 RepID=A0ABU5NVD7_9GAMM|nr:DUF4382 domain-containing protein [Marinobacter sp. ASW11-75]MEA1079687.1 DUF4382 domain-containing protein [Marinobacter sp. ASW11-75]